MNKVYAVSYDLKNPGRDYTNLYAQLKATSKWWHYLESTWLIRTEESPNEVWSRLSNHIDGNDRILIIEVRDNCQGWLSEKAWKWIHSNIQNP